MANSKISALTSATTPLAGTEVLPVVQSGATTKVSVANLTAGRDVSASGLSVDANSATDAVRITQTGAGNALLVEDSTNPDSTPFVVNSIGNVGIGGLPNNATTSLTAWTDTGAWANIAVGKSNNGDNASNFNFNKSRGTRSVPVIVNNSDNSGTVSFLGYDGSNYVSMANIRVYVDGTPGVNDMPGRLVLSTTADGASSPTERMRIDSAGLTTVTGTLKVTTGAAVGGATPGAGGVAFPATAVAVADANTLDDYEEGTWTPVVTFTGGNGDLTTAEALGVYTKIGRLVQIAFNVEFSETTAATNLTITGVPFTSGANVRNAVGCFVDNMTLVSGSPVIQLTTSSTTIALRQTQTGAEAAITNANTGASSRVRGSLSYSI